MLLYRLAWVILRGFILPVFGRWKVTGHENMPTTGGVIVAPNHVSYSDPPVVGAAFRRQVHFMAKEPLFRIPVLGALIRVVGAFPVKQSTADRGAIRKALALLDEGKVVCIYPEGTRNITGTLMKAELGIGLIAVKARVPIVPVALIGTEKLLPPHTPFLHFAKVNVKIGSPIPLDDLYDRGPEREVLEEIGNRVMSAISALMNAT